MEAKRVRDHAADPKLAALFAVQPFQAPAPAAVPAAQTPGSHLQRGQAKETGSLAAPHSAAAALSEQRAPSPGPATASALLKSISKVLGPGAPPPSQVLSAVPAAAHAPLSP